MLDAVDLLLRYKISLPLVLRQIEVCVCCVLLCVLMCIAYTFVRSVFFIVSHIFLADTAVIKEGIRLNS